MKIDDWGLLSTGVVIGFVLGNLFALLVIVRAL